MSGPTQCTASIAVHGAAGDYRDDCVLVAGHYHGPTIAEPDRNRRSGEGWHSDGNRVWSDLAEGAEPHHGLPVGGPVAHTARGFGVYAQGADRNGDSYSVQESSIATEPCLWFGQDHAGGEPARAHLSLEQAREVRDAITVWLVEQGAPEGDNERFAHDARNLRIVRDDLPADDLTSRVALGSAISALEGHRCQPAPAIAPQEGSEEFDGLRDENLGLVSELNAAANLANAWDRIRESRDGLALTTAGCAVLRKCARELRDALHVQRDTTLAATPPAGGVAAVDRQRVIDAVYEELTVSRVDGGYVADRLGLTENAPTGSGAAVDRDALVQPIREARGLDSTATPRDRAAELIDDIDHDCPTAIGQRALERLEASDLRVVPAPLPYKETPDGPIWVGAAWTVTALSRGRVQVVIRDDTRPNVSATCVFDAEVAAAITAAHARGSEHR